MKTVHEFEFEQAGRPPLRVVLEVDLFKLAHRLTSRAVQNGKKGAAIANGAAKVRVLNP